MQINAGKLIYIPITNEPGSMSQYEDNGFVQMVLGMQEQFYEKVGFHAPWIGYLAMQDDTVVGVGGYKGQPTNGVVEIAYATVPEYEGLGVSTHTCHYLTQLALSQDPALKVTARTLMEENASTRILRKNGFVYVGIVNDPEDGDVWEWVKKEVVGNR